MFPSQFIDLLKNSLSDEQVDALLKSLDTEPSVSIRINPSKISDLSQLASLPLDLSRQTSSLFGFFLSERPCFTNNPLLHQGAFYVQEASSMAFERVKEIESFHGGRILDLCAAPGGKSTHLLSLIRGMQDSFLVSNEVISSRATILAENIAKWGDPRVVVTNNDPSDFSRLEQFFDVVVVDAPCSGEGMFRKDIAARNEWSLDNVKLCASRQRRIISDVWPSLCSGGLLIYSTCTFNREEDENNVEWIENIMGAEVLYMNKFFPGNQGCGEGFFMAILQKKGENISRSLPRFTSPSFFKKKLDFVKSGYHLFMKGDMVKAYPEAVSSQMLYVESKLKVIRSGSAVATIKGNDYVPEAEFALSQAIATEAYNIVDVDLESALTFLSKGVLTFPDHPIGYLLLRYAGLPLGFVKNLGRRSNNLWNTAWRIRNL